MADMKDMFELITAESVRLALQQWHTTNQLGQNQMAQLNAVEQARVTAGYSKTDAGYGLTLQTHLRQVIEMIRPEGDVDLASKVWRPYLAITRHFIDGDHRDTVMDELHIARRTFYQAVNQAIEAIINALCALEEKSRLISTSEPTHKPKPVQNVSKKHFLTFVPPLPPQSLVVRPDAIADVKARLLMGEDVASSGLPGIGKTTLCSYIAHDDEIQSHFTDGILWAGLGRTPDLISILGEWCGVLGVDHAQLEQASDIVRRARLAHQAIKERHILIIIDDVWDSAAAFALQIGGEQCAHLLTSRYSTVALDFAANHLPLTELSAGVGVRFLHELAPVLTQSDPATSHTLTEMVGGLPLALMLIGRHIRKYSLDIVQVDAIIRTLQSAETRLNLAQNHHPLHRRPDLIDEGTLSLYSVIDLSYERLSEAEKQALCDLSLFPPRPNTFSATAALSVIGQSKPTSQQTFDALVANGLVESSGNGRYTIHQTIIDFGTVQNRQSQETIKRFLCCYTTPSEPIDFEIEASNLRQGMQFALTHQHPLLGVRLFDAFDQFFARRGLLQEQLNYLQQLYALAIEGSNDDKEMTLAYIAYWFGANHTHRRNYISARSYLEDALASFKKHDHLEYELKTLETISFVCQRLGQLEDGYAYCQDGLALCEQLGKPKNRLGLYSSLAFFAFQHGQYAVANQHIQQVIIHSEKYGTVDQILITKSNQAWIMAHWGDYTDCVEAGAQYELLLDQVRHINHLSIQCLILNGIAMAGCRLGNWKSARHAADEALSLATTFTTGLLLRTKRICGYVATVTGQYDEAEHLYDDAMNEAQLHGDKLEIIALFNQRSYLARLQKQFDHAINHAQAALTMAETMQIPPMKAAALHHLGTAQLGMGQETAAYDSLYQALTIYQSLDLHHFTIPLRARLAQCAVLQGDTAKAQTQIKPVLDYIKLCALKAVQDRGEIYEIVQDVLRVCGDDETAASLTW